MDFIFQRDMVYNNVTKTLSHRTKELEYSNFVGVSKLCKFGEQTLIQKLEKIYGKEKAVTMWKNSVDRGNKIHKKLETNTESFDLPESLGSVIGKEVFVSGNLGDLLVVGTLDAVYETCYGIDLIEYKTKSNRRSWFKNISENLVRYYMQLYAYSELFPSMYNLETNELKLVILFADKSEPLVYNMSRLDVIKSRRALYNKVSQYQNSGL